ncbi:hypothetical protein H8356DRAFT_1330466 [Neocallimastix lanati (nom. inval.)]|nr:hypothetical protein H8356DRAFT_1330466 [Neocallimastix sp. JGI-2020a]
MDNFSKVHFESPVPKIVGLAEFLTSAIPIISMSTVILIRHNDNTGSSSISTKGETRLSSSINDESDESLVDTTLSILKMLLLAKRISKYGIDKKDLKDLNNMDFSLHYINKVKKALYSIKKDSLKNPPLPIPYKRMLIFCFSNWASFNEEVHRRFSNRNSFTSLYCVSKELDIPPLSSKCCDCSRDISSCRRHA